LKANLPIEVDPEIMSGAPVFRGTRVPVQSLFEYLADNQSLDRFLKCFPTVQREDAIAVLEHSKREFLTVDYLRRRAAAGRRKAVPPMPGDEL
jgi:uncharacterized protein (DUF433 family)